MSTIVSNYDLIYKHMSEEDRQKLQETISAVLSKSVLDVQGLLTKEVEKAVSKLYSELLCNPWGKVIEENSGQYELLSALQEGIWKTMLKSDPSKVSEWTMRALIEAWQDKYPEEWKKCVGDEAARALAKLQEQYDFQVKVNQNRY